MLPRRIRPYRTPLARTLLARTIRALAASIALVSLLAVAPTALAAAPASVTVEVEGLTETKVPPTLVTTTTTPVVKDGVAADSCSGTSALGALELATAGNWSGPWSSSFHQYEIYSIVGESYQFEESSQANYYWSFWLNHKEASVGACAAELESGEQVLFFPACFGEACPSPAPTPLGIEAPALANAGEAVTVTVKQYNAAGEASPAVGASIAGGGVSATADSQGHATMRFSGDGTYTLHVNASSEGPPAVRTQTAICVHEGNDGTCGTTAPGSTLPVTSTPSSSTAPASIYTGPYALVAQATGVLNGHIYRHGHAPRVLAGKAVAHTAVRSVSIELRRSYRGHCSDYDAKRGRFLAARCGKGRFFQVSSGGPSFSYLLPAALPRGRYVYDIQATDASGNHAPLDRGSSRIVFYVH
jgi:hypothetical protein